MRIRSFSLEIKFCAHFFFITTTSKIWGSMPWQMKTTLVILSPILKAQALHQVACSHSTSQCISLTRIQQITLILHRNITNVINILILQQFWYNLPHSHYQPINSYNDDIGWVIQIYQNVVNNIKQNCRIHLHNMIFKRCKEVNWLLEGGHVPTSMDDVSNILCTKYNMIQEDGGVQYFSYAYYIIHTLSYNMNNSWVHKGIEDTVSTYHIDWHVSHGFVKIGNLVIDALKKMNDFGWSLFKYTFLECKHDASDK